MKDVKVILESIVQSFGKKKLDVIIREAQPEDAERYVEMIKSINSTSTYLFQDPEQYQGNIDEERNTIIESLKSDNMKCYIATYNGDLVGYIETIPMSGRMAHWVDIDFGVMESVRGRGVGSMLMQHMISEMRKTKEITRIQLEVIDGNPAINLYKRVGFITEGKLRNFIKIKNKYYDAYVMSILL